MGISVSLLLIAAGAIIIAATTFNTIGWILLIVGIVGIMLSLIFWTSWAGPSYFNRRRTYYDDGPAGPGGGAPY